jgi:hypothetical protein
MYVGIVHTSIQITHEIWVKRKTMIFVHPFNDNFDDNLVFLSSYWPKTMERKRKRDDKNIM